MLIFEFTFQLVFFLSSFFSLRRFFFASSSLLRSPGIKEKSLSLRSRIELPLAVDLSKSGDEIGSEIDPSPRRFWKNVKEIERHDDERLQARSGMVGARPTGL